MHVPGRSHRGQQVPGQQAPGGRLVAGQAEREQHAVAAPGPWPPRAGHRGRGQGHGQGHGGDHRRRGETDRGPHAVTRVEQRSHDRDRQPRGGLQVTGHAEGRPGVQRPRPRPISAPAGRSAPAPAAMNASTGGSVVITARLSPITGEATAIAMACSASRRHDRQRRAAWRSRTPRPAGPPSRWPARSRRFPGQPAQPGRVRQADQGHHGQVGVVGQPGDDLRGGQVGRAVVDQQRGGPLDDDHPGLERVGDGQPQQRRDHRYRHRDPERDGLAA